MFDGALFIAWERHRRSVSLASRFGIKAVFYESPCHRFIKFPLFVFKTLILLIQERPRVLFVQNPSLILSCLVTTVKPFFRFCLVVDAHNVGVIWYGSSQWFFQTILNDLHRRANITIVTNSFLAKIVLKNGGVPFVLPDAIPDILQKGDDEQHQRGGSLFRVTYICTFAADEPYEAVFAAAGLLPDDVLIFVTGRVEKVGGAGLFNCKKNVIFKGYLPDSAYLDLLRKSHCIVDLTTREDCLVCGAYEAVAVGSPMVLSDNEVTRNLFCKGAVYAQANPPSIAAAILQVKQKYFDLSREISDLRIEMNSDWEYRSKELFSMLKVKCNLIL